jgi:site-specific recombinase XerD
VFRNRTTNLVGKNAPKAILSLKQQQAFIDALPNYPRDDANPLEGWKTRRDRAMQALMLGAGLKVGEVIGTYTDNIGVKDSSGSVPVTISPGATGGVVRWHQTMLRPFAAEIVLDWVRERRKLGFPGQLLFPATSQGKRLNKATVYRHVKATFEQAGIEVPRQGGRTLRNAFAIRELKNGQTVEAVGEFLGHRRRRSIEPYLEVKDKVK